MTDRELSQRITDYLRGGGLFNPEMANHEAVRDLLIDCRDALAQPKQEPVAWMLTLPDGTHDWILDGKDCDGYVPLYTAPPRKEWVGLTDEEIKKIMQRWRNGYIDIKDVEQLLKEKNT